MNELLDYSNASITASKPIGSAFYAQLGGTEVLRIEYDGRIFWRGREVETDTEFRAAMIDLQKSLKELV